MSGDVQPRRRKDKSRRKKEEEDAGTPPPTLVNPSSDPTAENLTIHVHKEGGTGGHWCARIIFFSLLAILVGLIGVILIEHRGAADVDTPIAESRWATVFDGWVDDSQLSHEQAEHVTKNLENHEEEDEQEEEASEEAIERDEEEEEHAEESQEDNLAGEESEEQQQDSNENEDENTTEDDQGLDSYQDEDESEEEAALIEKEKEEESEEKEQGERSELEDNDIEESVEEGETENDKEEEDEEDEDDAAALEEVEENTSAEEGGFAEREEDEIINESDNEIDVSIEGVDILQEKQSPDYSEDLSTEFFGIPGVNEIDDNSAEPLEEVEEEEPEEIINETEIEPEVEEVPEESSSVAVKFGVGVALVVAAHFVLVRRWNNVENNITQQDSSSGRETPDLSRRNTIIPPPRAGRIMSTIAKERGEECEKVEAETYESLRSKYERLQTEEDSEEPFIRNQEGEGFKAVEKRNNGEDEEDDEELETSEGERLSGSEGDEVDEEEEEDEEDEEDVIDDSELVAKLEAKYGKLPTPPESEDEEEDDEEDDEDEEEEEEEEEENEDDEDIQGWKRVKAPRGAGETSKPVSQAAASRSKPAPKQGGARDYEHDGITNIDDAIIREELDAAQGQTAEKRISYFTALLSRHPRSPRGNYELAKALDNLAEERRDNSYLRKAINSYKSILELGTLVPTKLFRIVGERCIDRLRFSGQYSAAEPVHRSLIARFSDEPRLRNQLAVTYLMQNKLSEARKVLQEVLGRWPDDGFALVHYGFILKTGDGNMIDAIMYLKAGIESGHEGTIDGRFFFHLGDALVRLGRAEEATKIYQTGAEKGLFPSAYQRSLYNIDRLTARPWWTLEETGYKEFYQTLENNWLVIKAEGLAALNKNGQYKNEAENLRDKGNWQQFELFARGRKISENCANTPRTCALVERFPAAASCRRGQVKFSVMYPETHVWPHCGPTNCRLRGHLALSGTEGTYIRVGEETRTWIEGKVMVFDDSFEHEVWHNGTLTRLVLIVDVWHPELLESERRTLPAI